MGNVDTVLIEKVQKLVPALHVRGAGTFEFFPCNWPHEEAIEAKNCDMILIIALEHDEHGTLGKLMMKDHENLHFPREPYYNGEFRTYDFQCFANSAHLDDLRVLMNKAKIHDPDSRWGFNLINVGITPNSTFFD